MQSFQRRIHLWEYEKYHSDPHIEYTYAFKRLTQNYKIFYSMYVYPYSSAFEISIMYPNVLVILMVCVVEMFEVGMKILAKEIIFRFGYCIYFDY